MHPENGKAYFSVSSIHKGGLPKKTQIIRPLHLSKISPYSTHNLLIASAASPIYTWFFVYFASNTGSNFVITQLKFALTHPNFPLTHPNFALTQQNFTPNLSKQESLPSFRVKSSLLILGPFPAFTSKLHCHGMPCHT